MSWMPVTSDTSKSCFTVFIQVMCVRPGSPAWVLALTLVAASITLHQYQGAAVSLLPRSRVQISIMSSGLQLPSPDNIAGCFICVCPWEWSPRLPLDLLVT